MEDVIFLNKHYRESAPRLVDIVKELKSLKEKIKGSTTAIDHQLPMHGIDEIPIDYAIERQLINGYLIGKGITVLYPESGSRHFNIGKRVAYPANLEPELSLAVLVAMNESYQTKQQGLFGSNGMEKEFVAAVLDYLKMEKPSGADPRNQARQKISAANKFLRFYEALRNTHGSQDNGDFALMSAFTAAYQPIQSLLRAYSSYFETQSHNLPEFFKQPKAQKVNLEEVIGTIGGKPIKRFYFVREIDMMGDKVYNNIIKSPFDNVISMRQNATENT